MKRLTKALGRVAFRLIKGTALVSVIMFAVFAPLIFWPTVAQALMVAMLALIVLLVLFLLLMMVMNELAKDEKETAKYGNKIWGDQ